MHRKLMAQCLFAGGRMVSSSTTMVTRNHIKLTNAGAMALIQAASAKATAINVPECISVVDEAGELLAFSRMDGARPGSIEVALTKARSAARRRRATKDEAGGNDLAAIKLGLVSQLNVTQVGGGIPIVVDGQTIGAIGVSSGTIDEDIAVANAGIEAFQAQCK
eukprot:RCo033599